MVIDIPSMSMFGLPWSHISCFDTSAYEISPCQFCCWFACLLCCIFVWRSGHRATKRSCMSCRCLGGLWSNPWNFPMLEEAGMGPHWKTDWTGWYSTWWFIPLSKLVITPLITGISRVNPLPTGVITHLLSGMNHQVLLCGLSFCDRLQSSSATFGMIPMMNMK